MCTNMHGHRVSDIYHDLHLAGSVAVTGEGIGWTQWGQGGPSCKSTTHDRTTRVPGHADEIVRKRRREWTRREEGDECEFSKCGDTVCEHETVGITRVRACMRVVMAIPVCKCRWVGTSGGEGVRESCLEVYCWGRSRNPCPWVDSMQRKWKGKIRTTRERQVSVRWRTKT